ncbi:MAG: hypothetical protein AMXMBFR16_11120 [Candidatus Uhrbacteria bacterium]
MVSAHTTRLCFDKRDTVALSFKCVGNTIRTSGGVTANPRGVLTHDKCWLNFSDNSQEIFCK